MASNEAIIENPKQKWVPQFLPNCVYPLLRPTLKLNHPNGSPNSMVSSIRQLREAITLTIGRCSKLLQSFASQNQLIKNIPFFSQVRREYNGNVKLLSGHNFAAVLPGDSVAGVVVANGILNFLNIYNTLLVVRLVLTWFPNTPTAIVSPLSTLCDPYLNIFRGIIPPLGGTLDLSPILAFLVLNVFTSTAAALPAELPPTGASALSTSQEKWMRRFRSSNRKSSTSAC